jgi:hypothetical protein
MRKTIEVAAIKEKLNHILLNTPDSFKQNREVIDSVLVGFLHDTGNYQGFRYLTKYDMENSRDGHSFGINDVNLHHATMDEKFNGTDSSRRQYF